MNARITGTGSAVPEYRMTNDEIAQLVDTSDEWIRSRSGIGTRHIAREETTTSMAAEAAKRALEDAGIDGSAIDLIILATVSGTNAFPNGGCEVQREIGADHAVALELNVACSGFLFAMNMVQAYFKMGVYRTALVVGAETMSKMVDWTDRSTCVLFGDGAGAAVLQACDEKEGGLLDFVQYADGSGGEVLSCSHRPNENPLVSGESERSYMYMDGKAVFRFAVHKVPESIETVLERNQMNVDDVDCFVLHQANRRIIESAAKRLGADIAKFPMNMEEYGNTSAASIPILLDELKKSGRLKRGDKVILSGFGAGLTWGTALMQW